MAWYVWHGLLGIVWVVFVGLVLLGRWLSTGPREPIVIGLALVTIALFGLFHLLDRLSRAEK